MEKNPLLPQYPLFDVDDSEFSICQEWSGTGMDQENPNEQPNREIENVFSPEYPLEGTIALFDWKNDYDYKGMLEPEKDVNTRSREAKKKLHIERLSGNFRPGQKDVQETVDQVEIKKEKSVEVQLDRKRSDWIGCILLHSHPKYREMTITTSYGKCPFVFDNIATEFNKKVELETAGLIFLKAIKLNRQDTFNLKFLMDSSSEKGKFLKFRW